MKKTNYLDRNDIIIEIILLSYYQNNTTIVLRFQLDLKKNIKLKPEYNTVLFQFRYKYNLHHVKWQKQKKKNYELKFILSFQKLQMHQMLYEILLKKMGLSNILFAFFSRKSQKQEKTTAHLAQSLILSYFHSISNFSNEKNSTPLSSQKKQSSIFVPQATVISNYSHTKRS